MRGEKNSVKEERKINPHHRALGVKWGFLSWETMKHIAFAHLQNINGQKHNCSGQIPRRIPITLPLECGQDHDML